MALFTGVLNYTLIQPAVKIWKNLTFKVIIKKKIFVVKEYQPTVLRGWKFAGQRRDALRGVGHPSFHLSIPSSFSAPNLPHQL